MMAKRIYVAIWPNAGRHRDHYWSFTMRGVANDHVREASQDIKAEVHRLTAIAYRDGFVEGRRFASAPVRVVKTNSHTHWWKRNG